jgi:hypothetical protein
MRWAEHVAEVHRGFWWGNPKERDHLEEWGIDWRILLKWIFMKGDGSLDWIDLGQNRERWRAVVIAVMNLLVS